MLYRGATGREDVLTERNAHLHVSNLRCGKVKLNCMGKGGRGWESKVRVCAQ